MSRPRRKEEQALRLLATAINGPASCRESIEAQERYNLWASSWLVPALLKLVPQLKGIEVEGLVSSVGMKIKGKER